MDKITYKKEDYSDSKWYQLLLKNGIKAQNLSWNTATSSISFESPISLIDVTISGKTQIGKYSYMRGGNLSCKMGSYCSLAQGIKIGDGNHPMDWLSTNPFQYRSNSFSFWDDRKKVKSDYKLSPEEAKSMPVIGNDVWIGANVVITRGVTIGDGAVIGSGAIVIKDVQPYEIVGGVPAKHIRYRFNEEIRHKLIESRWWDREFIDLNQLPYDDPLKCVEILENKKFIKKRRKLHTLNPTEFIVSK